MEEGRLTTLYVTEDDQTALFEDEVGGDFKLVEFGFLVDFEGALGLKLLLNYGSKRPFLEESLVESSFFRRHLKQLSP